MIKVKKKGDKMRFIRSEEAVSETIGFILILGIIMTSIGIITAYGYPILEKTQENTQFQSTEQGFLVLQSNMKMVALDQSPIKTIKMGLGDGSITANSSQGRIRVNVDSAGAYEFDVLPGVIEYEKNGRKIAYENGGVWEFYPAGGTVRLSDPKIYVREVGGDTIVSISIINISGPLSSVGGASGSIVAEYNNAGNPSINSTNTVQIEVTSDYADAWERYFNEIVNTTGSNSVVNTGPPANIVTATIDYDKLIVNEYTIDVAVQ